MPAAGVKLTDTGVPYLELDDIGELLQALRTAGWTFGANFSCSSYDPTIITDLVTPTGRACTVSFADGVATVTIAGRVRTANLAKGDWLAPGARLTAINQLRNALPANQR